LVCSWLFFYLALMLLRTRQIKEAKYLMYGSFFYLPVVQLMFLFDFIGKGR
jgi:protoheme IX farnesyltransferase